jgi:hypothetical protein
MKTIPTAARALGLVCLLATAAAAQGRQPAVPAAGGAGPDTEITHATAPVVLDGSTLFRVRGFSLYPA